MLSIQDFVRTQLRPAVKLLKRRRFAFFFNSELKANKKNLKKKKKELKKKNIKGIMGHFKTKTNRCLNLMVKVIIMKDLVFEFCIYQKPINILP